MTAPGTRTVRFITVALMMALAVGNLALIALHWQDAGQWDIGVTQRLDQAHIVVRAPSKAALAAGVRAGDVLDLASLPLSTRVAFWDVSPPAGTTLAVPFVRAGHVATQAIIIEPLNRTARAFTLPWLALAVVAACGALAIGVFGRGAASLAAAVMFTAFSGYATAFSFVAPYVPPPWFTLLVTVLRDSAGPAFSATAALIGLLVLPAAVPRRLRAALWIAWALLVIVITSIWPIDYSGFLTTAHSFFNGTFLYPYLTSVLDVFTIAVFVFAVRYAPPEALPALRTLAWATGIGLGSDVVTYVFLILNMRADWMDAARSVAWLVLLAGYMYAFLARRLLSVEFVLERAALASAITLVLAGFFAALQWLLGDALLLLSGTHAQLAQLGITVLAFLLTRLVRRPVEDFVLGHLFRGRVRRLAAISDLARRLDDLEDPADVGPMIVSGLANDAAIDATLYAASDGCLRRLAGNGPEVLERLTPASNAQTSFPVSLRGRIRGALVCHFTRNEGAFDPDERGKLQALAHQVVLVYADMSPAEVSLQGT